MDIKNIQATYPLSPAQASLLEAHLKGQQAACFHQMLCEIGVDLKPEFLEAALAIQHQNHMMLRSFFVWERVSKPLQITSKQVPIRVTSEDLSKVSRTEQLEHIRIFLEADRERGFTLKTAPLLRVALFTTGPSKCWMNLSYHTLILDERSAYRLLNQLVVAYTELLEKRQPKSVPPLDWKVCLKWVTTRKQADVDQYWQQKCAGFEPATKMLHDRKSTSIARTRRVLTLPHTLEQNLVDRSVELATERKLFVTAAWALLLSRYTEKQDVLFGYDEQAVEPAGINDIIGPWSQMLPLRLKVRAKNVREWLAQLKQELASARANRIGVPDMRRFPRYESCLMFDAQVRDETGLWLEPPLCLGEKPRLCLHANLAEHPSIALEYENGSLDPGMGEAMLQQFSSLLQSLLARLDQPLEYLPMIRVVDRAKILGQWNDTSTPWPVIARLHELIEAQARRTPDQLALAIDQTELTYAALNGRANQLAHHLRAMGVGPDVLVATCMERTIELVVATLAIFKAGGVFFPLEPSQPYERKEHVLEDAQPPIVLVTEDQDEELPSTWAQLIYVDAEWEQQIANNSNENLETQTDADHLAYVLYTSGSTGRPKGVQVSGGALVNLCYWYNHYFEITSGSAVIQAIPVAFDASIKNTFSPMICGGATVLAPAGPYEPRRILKAIERYKVVLMNCVPTMFIPLLEESQQAEYLPLASLKYVALGGEKTDMSKLTPWLRSKNCHATYVNIYGPTETTDTSLAFKDREQVNTSAPVGSPIANTSVYILDAHLNLLPAGVPGQLMIAGIGLARGYLKRPALTAAAFIPNPYAEGERLYRTGDRAKWHKKGTVDFLGRVDRQIKLRGYRIELGEIESAIQTHTAIEVAHVIVGEERANKHLVAYVVVGEHFEARTSGDLREQLQDHLAGKLPSYMKPDFIVPLDTMPLTLTGKIDGKALPDYHTQAETEKNDKPTNWIEEQLELIWIALLDLKTVGASDSFFDVGGHSLLATQLISRIRDMFKVELTLQELFQAPTIKGMAQKLESMRQGSSEASNAIASLDRTERMPLSFAQQRLWFLHQLEGGRAAYNAAYNVNASLMLEGELNREAFAKAIERIVARHEGLRTVFRTQGENTAQHILPHLETAFENEDLRTLSEAELETRLPEMALAEAIEPFDLETGPLLRVKLLQLDEHRHALIMTLHHIIADAWSINIFIRELSHYYEAQLQDKTPTLPELTIQYADFAAWQRTWLQGERLEQQLTYWQEKLAGAPPLITLPLDRPRTTVQTFAGDYRAFTLTAEATKDIEQLGQTQGATLFMTLHAMLAIILSRYSGQDDISMGMVVANRTRKEIEPLIGFFVNTLVLRTKLTEEHSFTALLKQTRQTAIEAYSHQDLPFEQVVEAMKPERTRSHSPLFQVMIGLDMEEGAFHMPGVKITPITVQERAAKFEITIAIAKTADGLTLGYEYNTDLYDARTIEQMGRHSINLLENILKDSQRPIASYEMMDEQEKARLSQWSAGGKKAPQQQLYQHMFEAQVERNPTKYAAIERLADGRQCEVTYLELNQKANQIGHQLRERGVTTETIVGVCLESGIEQVACFLGILKAGGCYLPLATDYPRERLTYMIGDAGIQTLITYGDLVDALPAYELNFLDVLLLDEAEHHNSAKQNLESTIEPMNLAYMIYTSGSTGRPKGTQLSHRGLKNMTDQCSERFYIDAETRHLQQSSLSFDASISELTPALGMGGTLYLAPRQQMMPGPALDRLLHEAKITHLTITPTALANLTVDPEPPLKALIVAGEASTPEQLARWMFVPYVVNGYGPTESSVCVSTARCEDPERARIIGKPLPNITTLVLNKHLQAQPLGIAGELYVGGASLARCYHNRPGLTAERFIANPHGDEPGTRLYKTGDQVRWNHEGNLEYIGRIDQQVKLRGYRIELGEIQALLADHGMVSEVVVSMGGASHDKQQILAYIVPTEAGLNPKELSAYLAEKVPDYMVPSRIIELEAMPLTAHGKLDHAALAGLERQTMTYQAPESPSEVRLAEIWAANLDLDKVDAQADFFEAGGHSLLATRILTRIKEIFKVEMPVQAIFDYPTVASLAIEIDRYLPSTNLELGPVPVARDQPLPLSFAQKRLWFLDQLEPESSFYHLPYAARVQGPIDLGAMKASLKALVQRHEILRTTLTSEQAQPHQRISEEVSIDLTLQHLEASTGQEEACRRRVDEEVAKPFNLSQGPLMRFTLLKIAEHEHILIIVMHHIVSDGWSMQIMIGEFTKMYEAIVEEAEANPASQLPALPIQYADYAVWQNQRFNEQELQRQLDYWKNRLAGQLATLELPIDRPRPPIQTYRGAYLELNLSPSKSQALHQLAEQEKSTLYIVLLSAFKLLLGRYSGQQEIIVGTPVANRNEKVLEPLIGCFINTLVLRTHQGIDKTYRQWLGQVRKVALEAFDNQELPFEKLVEELRPERDLSRGPLFQAMFSMNPPGNETLQISGLKLTPLAGENITAKFELSLAASEQEQGLNLIFDYNIELFNHETVTHMADYFEELLERLAEQPDTPISNLLALTPTELAQLHQTARADRNNGVAASCLHTLIETSAAQNPNRTALDEMADSGTTLTYGELNKRANKLANYLRKLGVGPETPVAYSYDRSHDLIVSMLGILKAGGVTLPIDRNSPIERLRYMLKDAGATFLLADTNLTGEAYQIISKEQIPPDTTTTGLGHAVKVTPQHTAYIIYTSGSTGRPKGIAISHLAATEFVDFTQKEWALTETDRVLQFHAISFDTSIEEIYPTLAAGATLVLNDDSLVGSTGAFLTRCQSKGITILDLPSAYFHQLAADLSLETLVIPQDLRLVVFGGEQVHSKAVETWQERFGDQLEMINAYGPTETTVEALTMRLPKRIDVERRVPIGRSRSGIRTYVLNGHMQPVPMGVAGELYLEGRALSRGYLNQPSLTAASFVVNPFPSDKQQKKHHTRLYRTGDRARYRHEGEQLVVEYLGRIDHQHKIRGYRVEIGEVEAALEAHPGMREAAVIAKQMTIGGLRLIAFVVFVGAKETQNELMAFLHERLPEYMVPTVYVPIDKLPLTSSDKIDRRKLANLPLPEGGGLLNTKADKTPPRNAIEATLVTIFAALLEQKQVGVHGSFFDMGGHSLMATRALSRIRRDLAVEVPLQCLFQSPTAAGLATRIEALKQTETLQAPAMTKASREAPLPLSYAQRRLWFLEHLDPGNTAYNMPISLTLEGVLEYTSLQKAFTTMVARHEILRTTIKEEGSEPCQNISQPNEFALPRTELEVTEHEEEALRELAKADAHQPFDLEQGPLLRATLTRINGERHLLLINMHHIISDGWSTDLFIRELTTLYRAYQNGEEPTLREQTLHYGDFAAWQQQWLKDEVLEKQIDWWKKQLAELTTLALPIDHQRPKQQTYQGGVRHFSLSAERLAKLKELGHEQGTTLFMTLLSGYQTLMHLYCGQDDVAVGTPIANRTYLETETMLGFFVNTLVLRARYDRRQSSRDHLDRVRETTLGAYAHQEVPFEKLVEALQPQRALSISPLFQVFFQLTEAEDKQYTMPGLEIRPLGTPITQAKFDLTLSMSHKGNGLEGSLNYNTELFEGKTIERMVKHYKQLVKKLSQEPETPLNQITLLDEAERAYQVTQLNETRRAYESALGATQQFEHWAATQPSKKALYTEGVETEDALTYEELNRRANRLAAHLKTHGVGPDVPVGVCLRRGPQLVVTLLAIHKAGGAYVPMDPHYPSERLENMLAQSQAKVLVQQAGLEEVATEVSQVEVDEAGNMPGQKPDSAEYGNLDRTGGPANLSHIMYTSGTTGMPKGVAIRHQSVTALIAWMSDHYSEQELSGVLASTSICFDLSVFEILGTLALGGTVILAEHALALQNHKARNRVTLINTVPSAMRELMQMGAVPTSVRVVNLAGEPLSRALSDEVYKHKNVARVYNLYGPTEDTTYSTWSLEKRNGEAEPAIGTPLDNTRAYLLDRDLRLQPVGLAGELYLAGDGLARGYFGQPGHSAQRFQPNPYTETQGERMYRTGDRARYLADGTIQYLGRSDSQVKLRGFRIEPGEVEAALNRMPQISEAVVVIERDLEQMIAFLSGLDEEIDPGVLLAQQMPQYMIPSRFIHLEKMPLTANGKIDRRYLADLVKTSHAKQDESPPETELEQGLSKIWAELLNVPQPGIHSDFFALGGHSLLATRLITAIRQTMKLELPLRAVFEAPTIAKMAQHLEVNQQLILDAEAEPATKGRTEITL